MGKDKKVSDSSSSENLPKLEEKKDVTSFDEVDIDRHQRIFEKLGKSGKQQEEQTEDIQYVLDRIDELTLDQALEILHNTQEHHKNDLNFPESSRQLISELLSGPENFAKADYEFEVKAEAAIIYYFSPYPEVRAIANPHDNPDLPCETIRAYILGLIWAVIGQFINSFFNSRYPGITITSSVCQTLLYPCGEFVQYALPDWGITIRGTRHH
ncbi:DEKNAAC102211 [Brettanomyces naardenensis]|uniref:DEKNAAC102211 n=1 Tax=Brettanomyces naardenensis TaxID=13370 RepID=A0A448YL12_BRENA|nr:DEKNAAC102211 [Brettanomyces naardenensis]